MKKNRIQILHISLNDIELAVDLTAVNKVIEYRHIVPVTNAPEYVRGVIKLKTKIVPIICMNSMLGIKVNKQSINDYIIIMEDIHDNTSTFYGVLADSILNVTSINRDRLTHVGALKLPPFYKSVYKNIGTV